ncbi:hypothetical protein [Janibacter hoylei]|uniref:hypothetical protein n=1 Tax=Janibacter hoylei TaxID=364298 RepID=UPI0021A640A0|nr:hypothetical protein [Janibacter hoylei]MCT1618755.1 hypothetical protein [Janibacter hoylei]MCT2292841.1 hypothetical protein [Janibacter hoylei]MCW4602990.1 hypothetical protein [Janibacter hoylei]
MTDHLTDLESIADEIVARGEQQQQQTSTAMERARTEGARLTSGLERGGPSRFNPADYMDKPDPDAPRLEPSPRRGSSAWAPFVHSDAMAGLHNRVREALRREEPLAEPAKAARAWTTFVKAAEEALRLVSDVPAAMRRAEQKRAQQLADPGDEPVVLPSSADARAHAEAVAAKACREALALRRKYDETVEATAGERLEALAVSVPEEAAALRSSVDDLRGRLERLRAGVEALVESASSAGGPAVVGARLPVRAKLDGLDALVEEVEALVAVSEAPTEARLIPSREERRAIAAAARHVVGGFPQELIALASREAEEKAAGKPSTSFASHVPAHIVRSYRADAFHRA